MGQKPRVTKIVPPQYAGEPPEQNKLTSHQRYNLRCASEYISSGFVFADTEEGMNFGAVLATDFLLLQTGSR